MPTMTIEDRIEKVVDKLIANGEMFTLLDISQLVKNDGGDWMSHSTMKPKILDVLRNVFTSRFKAMYYTESNISVSTPVGLAQARLFHHVNDDPNAYTKRNQKAAAPKKQRTPPPGHPTTTGRKVIKSRSQSAQGYAEVPRKVWKRAGMTPGSSVVITVHKESITILRNEPGAKHFSKAQKHLNGTVQTVGVEKRVPFAARFRLSPSLLAQASLSGKTLDFSAFTDKIVVSKKF